MLAIRCTYIFAYTCLAIMNMIPAKKLELIFEWGSLEIYLLLFPID